MAARRPGLAAMIRFESYLPADLRPRSADGLLAEARRAMARQTVPAIFVYPVVAAWTGWVADQPTLAPVTFVVTVAILALVMFIRALLYLRASRAFDRDTLAFSGYLWLGVLSSALLSWYVGFLAVSAAAGVFRDAGFAIMLALAGGLVALGSIHRGITLAWVIASLAPMTATCLVAGDPAQRWLMALVALYFWASMRMIDAVHRNYWSAHVNAARLDDQMANVSRLSRIAGMAEIAVSVLHDVGNVLNSVLTSTGVIERELAEREDVGLTEVADLLDKPRDALVEFVTQDRRALVVGPYLRELADNRTRRRERLDHEVARLRSHVVHIAHIVMRQQEHARGNVRDEVALDRLLEEALDVVRDGLTRRGVAVELPAATGVEVMVDRHQALQILINLLGNARDAVDGVASPRVAVHVELESDRVAVGLVDNGCGFDEGTASRLFQHGFTTKPHGHGFGLHHSILLARAMGGELSARSPGPGRGATFTFTLPRVQVFDSTRESVARA
jgi:signal transduction histidine kinase